MADESKTDNDEHLEGSNVSLVPLYSPLDVSKGLQAYRRGDMILYTVRGEPNKVQELIGELDQRGVGEVVALVSHRAEEEPSPADAVVKDDEGEAAEGEEE
jgi:hypothetical protein